MRASYNGYYLSLPEADDVVRFHCPLPRCADIARLVERTLGKGGVGSSNLPYQHHFLISRPDFLCSGFNEPNAWLMW